MLQGFSATPSTAASLVPRILPQKNIGSGQGELGGLIMCDDVRYTARATQLNNFRVVTPVSELMSTVKIIHKHITPSQFHQSSLVCGSSFVIKPDGIVRWMMDIY